MHLPEMVRARKTLKQQEVERAEESVQLRMLRTLLEKRENRSLGGKKKKGEEGAELLDL